MADDKLNALRAALFRACEGYNTDEAIRALASTMTTIVIDATTDREAAHRTLDRLFPVIRAHVDDMARPAGTSKQ
jgi:hypothetical protein